MNFASGICVANCDDQAETTAGAHHQKQRSHSISPQRVPRWRKGGGDGNVAAWKKGSSSFRHSSPLQRESRDMNSNTGSGGGGGGSGGPAAVKLTDKQNWSILQSMGQSVHIFDLNYRILYWNRSADNLYGYSAAEALGKDVIELLADPEDSDAISNIVHRVSRGESWTGRFQLKIRAETEAQAAAASEMTDSETSSSFSRAKTTVAEKLGLDQQQPLQAAIASKLSNLASKVSNKVKLKMRPAENNLFFEGGSVDSHHSDHGFSDMAMPENREDAPSSRASTPRGDIHPSPFGVFSGVTHDSGDEGEGRPGISRILSTKAEAWITKKGLTWPWKGNEQDGTEPKSPRFGWPWSQNDELGEQKSAAATLRSENRIFENSNTAHNGPGSWSSSSSDISTLLLLDFVIWEKRRNLESSGPMRTHIMIHFSADACCGSCGTVYHGLWYGSDIAVKVFSRQEYSDDLISAFRQEVSLMKSLRHPNILLFMGAVKRLCIVTEFLPRYVSLLVSWILFSPHIYIYFKAISYTASCLAV
ncbi:hypothetical protein ACS0TY_001572 [Phlomoides rotata]